MPGEFERVEDHFDHEDVHEGFSLHNKNLVRENELVRDFGEVRFDQSKPSVGSVLQKDLVFIERGVFQEEHSANHDYLFHIGEVLVKFPLEVLLPLEKRGVFSREVVEPLGVGREIILSKVQVVIVLFVILATERHWVHCFEINSSLVEFHSLDDDWPEVEGVFNLVFWFENELSGLELDIGLDLGKLRSRLKELLVDSVLHVASLVLEAVDLKEALINTEIVFEPAQDLAEDSRLEVERELEVFGLKFSVLDIALEQQQEPLLVFLFDGRRGIHL